MAEEKYTLDNIKGDIAKQLTRSLNFPIQSQHEGNCASDSIQIILTFSDLIGPAFAELTLAMYYEVYLKQQKVDLMHLTTKQVQTMMDVGVSASDEQLSTSYLLHSQIRYLKMMSDYKVKVQKNITTGLAVRMESAAGQAGVSSGTVCSLVFAIKNAQVYGRGIKTIKYALAYHYESKRNRLYGYSAAVYDPIVLGVLKVINGYIMKKTGNIHFGMSSGNTSKLPEDADLRAIVGIQVFCKTSDGFKFHTFTFFRFSGIWHIGDNEVGLATPTTWTIEDLVNNEVSFKADLVGTEYKRTYYLKNQRISVRYKLTDTTSGEYELCSEENARVMKNNLYRRYFYVARSDLIPEYSSFVSLPQYRKIEETVNSMATYDGIPYTGYFSDYSEYSRYPPKLAEAAAVGAGAGAAAAAATGVKLLTSGKEDVNPRIIMYGDLNYLRKRNLSIGTYEDASIHLPKKTNGEIKVFNGKGSKFLGVFTPGKGFESITFRVTTLQEYHPTILESYGFSRQHGGALGDFYSLSGSFRSAQSGGSRKRTIKTRKHHSKRLTQ